MVAENKYDLINTGPGTSYSHDFHDRRNDTGIRTHFVYEGVDTPNDAAADAHVAEDANFPGTSTPIHLRTTRMFENGRAIVVERYRRRRSSGGSTSASTALIDVVPSKITLPWFSKPGTNSTINNTFDPFDEDARGVQSWNRSFTVFAIHIPTVLDTTPLTSGVLGMIDKVNDGNFSIAGTTFAAYTLQFQAPYTRRVLVDDDPATYQYITNYVYLVRLDGWYREGHRWDSGVSTVERRLMFPETTFSAPPFES